MGSETATANHRSNSFQQLLPAVAPVLLITVGYVDPGKLASSVEGGARFGCDLVAPMLAFNFAAILCQYLSARVAVVTGRDLSQICSMEYDKAICIFLGVQAELCTILWDLTMILGTGLGLNLIFGVDLFACVFLTIIDAFLYPLFSILLENGKAKFFCLCMASFLLLFYVCGVIISLPEIRISMNGTLTKFSGESVFALMSLLGANVMPRNFYLHSSLVQQNLGTPYGSKEAMCLDHLFAILCIFSGISIVNYVLMNSAANVFHNTGHVLLTFQEALSLMDQAFRSPIALFAPLLVLLSSNHITALTSSLGREAILLDFFGMDIPGWLHHTTIRIVAIIPALYCVWSSRAEGVYQLLIYTQVTVALVLPASVIPLFRIASSKSIMGVYKVSRSVEFLTLITFVGMLGLELIFVAEMIFGNSDWVGNLKWNMWNSISIPYVLLLTIASASLCLMLWLAATPLKSESSRLDAQPWHRDIQNAAPESSIERPSVDFAQSRHHEEQVTQKHEPEIASRKLPESHPDLILPDTLFESDDVSHLNDVSHLTTIDENSSEITYPSPSVFHSEELASRIETIHRSTVSNEVCGGESLDKSMLKSESADLVEKTVRVEGDSLIEKDYDSYTWEHEDSLKGLSMSSTPLTTEGPGSFRSLSGKGDEAGTGAGSGTGSLSRLAGLGRAARRHLAAVLDEFWGQLYDFHGQATQEAKARKLDMLLGAESKVDPKPAVTLTGYLAGRGSGSVINSRLYDSPKQPGLQRTSMESSPYGVQRGSPSLWSNRMQLLDAYVQNTSRHSLDSGERRHSALLVPPSSDGSYDYQPATVHGYQIASYLSQIAKENSFDYMNGQIESLTPNSSSLNTSHYRDSSPFALGPKPPNGSSPVKSPRIPNPNVSRNSSLQPERPFYDFPTPGAAENLGTPAHAKKFYSLPDISGLLPQRDTYLPERGNMWDNSVGYGPSVGRKIHEQPLYSSASTRTRGPTFDQFSPYSQIDSSPNPGSFWSRQPFEQFGISDKTRNVGAEGVGCEKSSSQGESVSNVDSEARILQSFRHCISKLLKLEGSDWLFRQNDGADEDLIDRVAARERFLYESETRDTNQVHVGEFPHSSEYTRTLMSLVPHCGEGCIWRVDLIISFGVWCIHRILELSLMESRPELWGKYTYVLNRLQGIIDPAFSKPRSPLVTPCLCLQIHSSNQRRSSPPIISNGSLPPPAKQGRGKCTTAASLLEIIKDVELAISSRKGRTGTAAGDVAFPKGKENLASVLKRYRRRLSNNNKTTTAGTQEGGAYGSRKIASSPYAS